MEYFSINPYNSLVIAQHQLDNDRDLNTKIEKSKLGYAINKIDKVSSRVQKIVLLSNLLERDKAQLAEKISLEMGKIYVESLAEIEKCVALCNYYAENAETFLGDCIINRSKIELASIVHSPIGVVLGIMPWNFPIWQVFRFAIPAYVAGNAILLKHAENVWCTAKAIKKLWDEAGIDDCVFQSLYISHEQTKILFENNHIQAVSFTGSRKAGSVIAGLAGQNIIKSVLELGSNDVMIVLSDSNLELAAQMAIKSRMINNGQSCIATKRLLVESSVYQKFLDLCVNELLNYSIGDPFKATTKLGPLARPDLKSNLLSQVNQSLLNGANSIVAYDAALNETNFVNPIVLADIPFHTPAFTEEIFGPVLSIISFNHAKQAVDIANNSVFGLGASIWTNDEKIQKMIIDNLDVGAVYFNQMVYSRPDLPFGGVKQSGYGKELGREGLMEFVNYKSVLIKK
jgi:succinate-semialdehyde dehydrogenase/glutarate-semialdehyde dehydrogenase